MAGDDKAKLRPARPRRRRTQIKAMFTIFAVLGAILAALPSLVVFVVGMVPTLTWFIVDMTPGRYACRCIAGFNIAGISPYMYKLWFGANSMPAAVNIITDPYALLAFYGASTLGLLLFMGLPGIVAMIRTLNAERQVRVLRSEQRDLIEEWGKSVAGRAAPPDDQAEGEAGAEEEPAEAGT